MFHCGTCSVQNAIRSVMIRMLGSRRVDPLLLGDVLLEDVVLQRAAQLLERDALLLGHGEVHAEDHRGRGVDRHRRGDLVQRDPVEQRLHVGQGVDGHALPADLAAGHRRRRCPAPSASAGRRPSTARSARVQQVLEALVRSAAAVPNPANWRMVQSRPRYIVGWTPRV